MDQTPEEHIAELRAEIARHDRLYYKEAQPQIDDTAYDRLKARLSELEAQYPLFASSTSPTQSVGDDRASGFEPIPTACPCSA